jgi:hypothetical protein
MSPRHRLLLTLARLATFPVRLRLWAFERACHNPQAIQERLLLNILQRQSVTAFGQDHHFQQIRTVADYRRQVPVAPYEYVEPYIQRVAKGETSALIAKDRVLMFALTSGTTAARKLIPVTTRFLADYRRGWNMWGMKVLRDHRHRYNGMGFSIRPMVQMVGNAEEYRTLAGIPCGALSGFTAQVQKRLVKWLYTVPAILGQVSDTRTRYYVALRLSIGRPCAMLLAANPSSLLQLARTLNIETDSLLKDLAEGTLSPNLDLPAAIRNKLQSSLQKQPELAAHLTQQAAKVGRLFPQDIWPSESILLGTWTGGSMGHYLQQLPRYYGETLIRDLGLLASEGRFTIPLDDHTSAGVLDIWSHYFEFIPEAEIDQPNPTTLGVHEIQDGQNYFIIPTTASGLYRYHISDLVRVRGFYGRTPLVEFLGKGQRISNLTGEKLSEYQVTQAVNRVCQQCKVSLGTYSVAPIWDDNSPQYGLFVEESQGLPNNFAELLDTELQQQNIEYASKRQSNRLGTVKSVSLPDGFWAKWDQDRLKSSGGSPEQYKHPCLIVDKQFASL